MQINPLKVQIFERGKYYTVSHEQSFTNLIKFPNGSGLRYITHELKRTGRE